MKKNKFEGMWLSHMQERIVTKVGKSQSVEAAEALAFMYDSLNRDKRRGRVIELKTGKLLDAGWIRSSFGWTKNEK